VPIYDVKCTNGCGYFEDVFALLADVDDMRCSKCNESVVRVMSPVRTIGPTFSKPLVVDQIGRTFTSSKDWNNYQRANPDVEILSASSQSWRKHKDRAREKVELAAKRKGYRDSEHLKAEAKKNP